MLPSGQNPILEGIVIENTQTYQIIDINNAAKEILNISDELPDIKKLFANVDDFEKLHNNENVELEGVIDFKTLNGQTLETQYKISKIDEKTSMTTYIFKSVEDNLEILYKRLSDFFPGGIIVMDIDENITVAYANTEAYNIIGVDNKTNEIEKYRYLKDFIYEEDKDWVTAEIHEILSKNKEVDIEFRVKTLSSSLKWVRLYGYIKDGTRDKKFFFASLKDLSMRRDINDGLHIERILFNKIAELTNEIIFRLDLQTNVVYFLGKKSPILKGKTVLKNFPQSVFSLDFVYHEDIHLITEIDDAFRNGIMKNFEVRKVNEGGSVDWYKVVYSFVNNDHGQPLIVTGKFVNITEQKILEEQAKTDLLTGFLNKITTELEIDKILNPENMNEDLALNTECQHALFIVDIDFFKSINDNLGHHFGDTVLQEVANEISRCFRNNDLLGRIGGDEFIILMTNSNDDRAIVQRAELLCKSLQKTYAGKDKNYSISASVGIAKYPNDGTTYKDLYQKADLSLYVTKENGKNGFSMYNGKLDTEERRQLSNFHTAERVNNETIDPKTIENIFKLIYENKDVDSAVQSVLEYLGKHYGVDRCSLFQTFDNGKTFTNVYLWVSDDADTIREKLDISGEFVEKVLSDVDENGIYYKNNVQNVIKEGSLPLTTESNVKSGVVIELGGNFAQKSLIILDDCQGEREWKYSDTKTIFHIGCILLLAINNSKHN